MKILYVITGLGQGGAERVVADLADQMVVRGHEVKIAYLKGNVLVKPDSEEVELICLGLESGKNFIAASQKYHKLIKRYQPNAVHAHMIHANIFTRLNRIGASIPKLICTAHSSNEGGRIRMLAYKYTNFLSDFNSNVSKEAVQAFIDKGSFTTENLEAIYNGINLKKFTYNNEYDKQSYDDKVIFFAVGRFNEAKDYPNLLNAFSIVLKKNSNIHLNIAGDGELRSDIENLIRELNLSEKVTLLGRRDDIPGLMSQSNFFVLPSKYEGFGLVVAEAMACGTFVIATDCGGVKEVMGGNGLLVSPENNDALSRAMIEAINMPIEAISANNHLALNHVKQNFDLNKIIDQWEEIYVSK